jgi:hypothetical protein
VAGYDERALQGHWVHSHEEDTTNEMVFRPADRAFPRSRGRASIDLRPDGSYVESSPGPVDAPEETGGSWALEGDRLVLGDDRAWEITSAEPGRLTVRK